MSTWRIDPAHTDVSFSARHMMVTTVRGKFREVEGTLTLDEAEPTRSSGRFRVAAASVDTGVDPRDNHLRSPDFFDVERFPAITFRSTAVEARGGDRYAVTGELTIRDTTRSVTFDVELLGFYRSMQGGRRVGLGVATQLNRKDWGLNWNIALEAGGWLVGETATLSIDVAADEVTEAEKPVEAEMAAPGQAA